jgi:carboxyl-terminal processing protease
LDKRDMRLGLTVWATLFGVLLFVPSVHAADLSPELQEKLARARALEKNGDYAKAWELYYQIRKAERNPPKEVTDGYQFCLRRVQQARRLRDKPAQALTADLRPSQALTVYTDDVLTELQRKYVDRNKVGLGDLFQYGVQEMRFALEDEEFLKDNLKAGFSPEALQAFKDRLDGLRVNRPAVRKLADARDQLQSVMLSAAPLGIKPTAVLVEFVSGACNALDEYTGYLSPRRLAEVEADLSGKSVGIGVGVRVIANEKGVRQLVITGVYATSPAAEKMLQPNDVILSIDGEKPDPAKPGALVARLEGEVGTAVELEVISAADGMKRKVKVERRAVPIPSVAAEPLMEGGVGYVRVLSFQKTTPDELRSALLLLRSHPEGLKALVLDLRGNLGGLSEAAIQVAELFLSEGVIVYTHSRTKEEVRRANNPDALAVPMVVLVDGETASAAEIVAGALKDNSRARLVGQTTFGKGSMQCLVKLDSLKAGMQVTFARFASPGHVFYEAHGITPHEVVENTMTTMMSADPQRARALYLAGEMAKEMMPSLLQMPSAQ